MAVNLVQSASGSAAFGAVTHTFNKRVTAGNLIVACLVQKQSPVIGQTATCTDNHGDAYQIINGAADISGLVACVCYAFGVAGGTTTVTLPNAGDPCAYAIHEFSGVLATSDPGDDSGSAIIQQNSVAVDYAFSQAGELIFGAVVALGNVTLTAPAGLTIAQRLSSANGSILTGWASAPSPQSGTYNWSTSGLPQSSTAGLWCTFLHS